MDLSIIIVNWNTKELLGKCLDAVINGSDGISKEIFVVDNNSADGSSAFIRENYPQVKLVENGENLGFSRANNIAIKKAAGKYIILLNPDTVVGGSALSKMTDFLDKNPDTGMVGPKLLNTDGTVQLAGRRSIPNPKVAFYRITGLSKLFPNNKEFAKYNLTFKSPDEVQEVEAVSGACMMIRKKTIDEVGLLDESFFMYGEDLDWCYRVAKAGWKIYFLPFAAATHYHRASSRKRVFKSTLNFYHAMYVFHKKHFSKNQNPVMNFLIISGIGVFAAFSVILNVFKELINKRK